MKFVYTILIVVLPILLIGQAQEATLLGNWQNDSLPPTSWLDSRYNEVWGVAINDLEIGIIGSTMGVHFIDVTDPQNPVEITNAFVAGAAQGTNLVHRDYHDYNGYLYTVADEGQSTLQIIDISTLPDSTSLVYNSSEFLRTAHNIFIDADHARLYSCGVRKANSQSVDVQIFSLENPASPLLLADATAFANAGNIPYVHDLYVRDNIAYLNCGNSGFYVADFNDPENPILLGSMTNYPQSGYNHSGWLDQTGHYYYLADETHGTDIKVVDVCDNSDISVTQTFDAEAEAETSIVHNLIVHCNLLYTSYYYDGLQVFDISDPLQPVRIAYYDTYDGPDDDFFKGAWGIYPFLPSGNILLSDMQTGLYVFEALEENCDISPPECPTTTSTNDLDETIEDIRVFPQPTKSVLQVEIVSEEQHANIDMELFDITGKRVQRFVSRDLLAGKNSFQIRLNEQLHDGFYVLKLSGADFHLSRRIIINK